MLMGLGDILPIEQGVIKGQIWMAPCLFNTTHGRYLDESVPYHLTTYI